MTLLANTARRLPTTHAFTVPVVRELPPQSTQLAASSAW